MKIYSEIKSLDFFPSWNEGNKIKDIIVNAGKGEEFIKNLEVEYPNGLTFTELNELLWQKPGWCMRLAGLDKKEA